MKRLRTLAVLLAAFGAEAACSTPNSEPTAGSESHFLTACVDTCGSGLACLCGTCTTSCSATRECASLNPAATCVAGDPDAGPVCAEAQPASHCDVACSNAEDCAPFGVNFFCSRGFCRTDPLSRPNEPFPGYGLLCAQNNVTCATGGSPPQLTGTYTGQATVVLSSNALWAVNDVNDFTADITSQTNLALSGVATLPSFTIDIQSADIRGQTPAFSIYSSTYVNQNGCNLEVRSVLSGVLDSSAAPSTVTGGLALRFTGNYSGSACTADQIENYPETGANFGISATGQ